MALRGRKKQVYSIMVAQCAQEILPLPQAGVYHAIKAHLSMSGETMGEKQLRVAKDWSTMVKAKHMAALVSQSLFFKCIQNQS